MLTVKSIRTEQIWQKNHHDGERIYKVETVGVYENDALVRKERHNFWYDSAGHLIRVTTCGG